MGKSLYWHSITDGNGMPSNPIEQQTVLNARRFERRVEGFQRRRGQAPTLNHASTSDPRCAAAAVCKPQVAQLGTPPVTGLQLEPGKKLPAPKPPATDSQMAAA